MLRQSPSRCVIHPDIRTGNILFPAPGLFSCTTEEVEHDTNASIMSVFRPDGKLDKWAPRYIAVAWPLIEYAYHAPGLLVRITDLGGGKLKLYSFTAQHQNFQHVKHILLM